MKTRQYYKAENLFKFAEEDIFSEGCIPETSFSIPLDMEFTGVTAQEVITKIQSFLCIMDESAILLDSCEEPGRVDFQVCEDVDGVPANDYDIQQWKEGRMRLYHCTYTAYISHITERSSVPLTTANNKIVAL